MYDQLLIISSYEKRATFYYDEHTAEYKRKRAFWKEQELTKLDSYFQKVLEEEEWLIHYAIKQLHIYKNKEEFYQEGLIGLWEAYERFDDSRGVAFRTFAWRTIRGKMLTLIVKSKKREDRQAALTESVIEMTADPNVECPFELENLLLYCHGLTVPQRNWVLMHFIEGKGQKEISAELKVSLNTVKSWRKYALQKIRKNIVGQKDR